MNRIGMNRTVLGLSLGLSCALGTMALADEFGISMMDTGASDTGAPATDDTGSPPEDDTAVPSTDDTGSPPADDTASGDTGADDTGADDTGEPGPDDTGETDPDDTAEPETDDTGANDTGSTHIGDTGPIGLSAAELAGEKGGCGCASTPSESGGLWWLGVLGLIGLRRRR